MSDSNAPRGTISGVPGYKPTQVSAEDPLIGTTFAERYLILRKIGEGGMGAVYEANHIVIEKRFAVKVLAEDHARKNDLVQRFLQEARAASRIGHANIVDVSDFGATPSGTVFIVMEYLDGADLAHVIRDVGPLGWERSKPLLLQTCRALTAAHGKGIIHRDLKPENIFLITRDGNPDFVKIVDFGIAKMSTFDTGGESARLTKTGMIFGTPEYMSPEQANGTKPDHRVDIYAVGVIMYEMVTGTVPFKADTFMGILTKHMFEVPTPPSKLRPDLRIPADVEAIVLRALEKDRDKRFQSMQEFEEALAGCAGTGRMSVPPPDPRTRSLTPAPERSETAMEWESEEAPPRRSKTIAVVAGGGVLAAAVAGFLLLGRGSSPMAVAPAPATSAAAATAGATPSTAAPMAEAAASAAPAATTVPVARAGAAARASTGKMPTTPAPVVPANVAITFTTQPDGATVFRGDEAQGKTPLTLQVPTGSAPVAYLLRRKGFRDQTVDVLPDRTRSFELDLVREGGGPGLMKVKVSKKSGGAAPARSEPAAEPPVPREAPAPPAPPSKLKDLKDPFGN